MSEFGKGYAYCLGLFLAHAERKIYEFDGKIDGSLWFNGAADHLFELRVPNSLPAKRRKEIKAWVNQCLKYRLCMNGETCGKEQVTEALKTAKNLLLEWDKYNKISCKKGDWE